MKKSVRVLMAFALCAPLAASIAAPAPPPTQPPPAEARPAASVPPQPAPPVYAAAPEGYLGYSCEQRRAKLEEIVALQKELIDALKAENATLRAGAGPNVQDGG